MNPHRWFNLKIHGRKKSVLWTMFLCIKCGLVSLKNEKTQKAVNKECKGALESDCE